MEDLLNLYVVFYMDLVMLFLEQKILKWDRVILKLFLNRMMEQY